jgi:hypothetical protein
VNWGTVGVFSHAAAVASAARAIRTRFRDTVYLLDWGNKGRRSAARLKND